MAASALEMLHPRVRGAMERLGYQALLPVQERAIPVILSGSHTLVVAPTGSGKTEAALLPVLSMMASLRDEGRLPRGVKAVYVTPLRALNRDIERRIRGLVEHSGFRVQVRHGDTGPAGRRRFLRDPPDVMVTTPESLTLLLAATAPRGLWGGVRWVIVDEIHELIESERGAELALTLERLSRLASGRVQRIALSATLSERGMREAAGLLAGHRRVEVVVERGGKEYEVGVVIVEGRELDWARMVETVADIVKSQEGQVLVFVNTRSTAEKLASELARRLGGESVRVHHGSLARSVREEAERLFKEGRVKVLVATSSMELGIDVGTIRLVVQFMSPRQVMAMTQRAGRAGHRLGETSRAVIVAPQNLFEAVESAVIAFRTARGHLEDLRAPRGLLCPVAHQAAALAVERGSFTRDDLLELLSSTMQYDGVSPEEVDELLEHLDSVKVLRYDPLEGTARQGRRTRSYLYRVSMIPDEVTYTVIDMVEDRKVGEVSERFVEASLLNLREGERLRFVLAGRLWEAVEIDDEEAKMVVKPIAEAEGFVPVWHGELIPVSYKVAREVCSLISLAMDNPSMALGLLESRGLRGRWAEWAVEVARSTAAAWGGPLLEPSRPVVEVYPSLTLVYACLGSRGNQALALLLSELLSARDVKVSFNQIPYAIVLMRPDGGPVPGDLVASALREAASMDPVSRAGLIYEALRRSQAFTYRFLHVARRLGVLDPGVRVPASLLRRVLEAYRDSVVEREVLRELAHDMLDLRALEDFLSSMKEPAVVSPGDEATPLAEEVLGNPYLRQDIAVNIKEIALGKLIDSLRRRLSKRRVRLLCIRCGHSWEVDVSRVPSGPLRCPRCGMPTLAPLPTGEWGSRVVEALRKSLRGERLSREESKLVREARERASLYMHYAFQGYGRIVVEALMARGVGPSVAKRVIERYFAGGEREFYRAIMEAEEKYIATRKYWDSRKPRPG
ncbi:MAG: DEAD/DEAH box helicase [Desulfurococcales archaeon]|nr:DEAD/DEAH box helicase [Desulfurococcales archaeon]